MTSDFQFIHDGASNHHVHDGDGNLVDVTTALHVPKVNESNYLMALSITDGFGDQDVLLVVVSMNNT